MALSDRRMSLIQLRDRLTEIVNENEAQGRANRNDLPVLFETKRTGRKGNEFTPVAFATSSQLTLHDNEGVEFNCVTLEGYESQAIKPTKDRNRKIYLAMLRKMRVGVSPDCRNGYVCFGILKRAIAKEFANWLKTETAWSDVRVSRGRSFGMVWITGADVEQVRSLVDEFMSL